jgi:hypothetical protein
MTNLSIWIISQYHQGWEKGSQNHFHLGKRFACGNKVNDKKRDKISFIDQKFG